MCDAKLSATGEGCGVVLSYSIVSLVYVYFLFSFFFPLLPNTLAYSAQSRYQHPQYTQDGGYYDGAGGTVLDGTVRYDYQAYYHHPVDGVSQYDGSTHSAPPYAPPPPPLPPPDILPVVTKTAEYVAKNGDAFERTVLERHAGDPRFGFLNPWDKSHAYYQMLKQQHKHRLAYEAYSSQMGWNQNPGMGQGVQSSEVNKENTVSEPTNLQRLSESGTVSFKLQPKATKTFDPSSLVDLGTSEDAGEAPDQLGEGQTSVDCNGHEEDGPPSKKPRVEWVKMGTKVEVCVFRAHREALVKYVTEPIQVKPRLITYMSTQTSGRYLHCNA